MENKLTDAELKELAKIKRNEYLKNWRSKNKDKVKQYQANYWIKKARQEVKNQ